MGATRDFWLQQAFFATGTKMIGMFGMGDPKAHWRMAAVVDLQGPELEWKEIEHCGTQG